MLSYLGYRDFLCTLGVEAIVGVSGQIVQVLNPNFLYKREDFAEVESDLINTMAIIRKSEATATFEESLQSQRFLPLFHHIQPLT